MCPKTIVNQLDLLGFSGISNMLSAIKFAKYYEMGENDIVLTVLTDSMELYGSRLKEMHAGIRRIPRDRRRRSFRPLSAWAIHR